MSAVHAWPSHRRLRDILKSHHVWRFAGAVFVLLLSWPAAAQTTYCDSTFGATGWLTPVPFISAAPGSTAPPGSVIATQPGVSIGGTSIVPVLPCLPNSSYRDVTDTTPTAANDVEATVYGFHIYTAQTYSPSLSGPIATIAVSMDYECPDSVGTCLNADGQAFGPAVMQNGKYFVVTTFGASTGVTTGWKTFTSSGLTALNFYEVLPDGSTSQQHPDFSSAGAPINCGFYTANFTYGGSFQNHAGYDNWQCVITPSALKLCKVAGPGITLGTAYTFSYATPLASGLVTVPAGPAPGGYCELVPNVIAGSPVTVQEYNPPSHGANITVNGLPPSPGLYNGNTVNFSTGNGITEVTYTNTNASTGYLEICKQQVPPSDGSSANPALGNSTFTLSPWNPGPIVVPAGACSPAIEVPAGPVTIHETPTTSATMTSCVTIPASQLARCTPGAWLAEVKIVAGGLSTQTIAIIANQATPINPNGGNGNNNNSNK